MKKRFGKADLLFLAAVCGILAGIWLVVSLLGREEGATLVITVDGEFYREASLDEEQTIEISIGGKTTNILKIQKGRGDMVEADCPDQLCVHQKAVSKTGETIVCLPNRVVAEVKGSGEPEFDAVAR